MSDSSPRIRVDHSNLDHLAQVRALQARVTALVNELNALKHAHNEMTTRALLAEEHVAQLEASHDAERVRGLEDSLRRIRTAMATDRPPASERLATPFPTMPPRSR